MRDIAEILEHWHAGRPLQAAVYSLGADRKTARADAALARAAEELDAAREEIAQALGQLKPATAWRRLQQAGRLSASWPSFSRSLQHYALDAVG